jgi:hypothetical protein
MCELSPSTLGKLLNSWKGFMTEVNRRCETKAV